MKHNITVCVEIGMWVFITVALPRGSPQEPPDIAASLLRSYIADSSHCILRIASSPVRTACREDISAFQSPIQPRRLKLLSSFSLSLLHLRTDLSSRRHWLIFHPVVPIHRRRFHCGGSGTHRSMSQQPEGMPERFGPARPSVEMTGTRRCAGGGLPV